MKELNRATWRGFCARVSILGAIGVSAGLASGCHDDNSGNTGDNGTATNVVYVLSNSPTAGQNSVLAYRRAGDGSLSAMSGSPFLTGGTGTANPTQALGPDDIDTPIAVSADHHRMFAVNPGSNTIAVMTISSSGALTPVPGSPFASGGINPASVAVSGDKLFVLNKSNDPAQITSQLPNYTAFTIASTGALTPIVGSTVNTIAGASPQLVLLSPSKTLLFGADFMAPGTPSHQGALRSFTVSPAGALAPAPGTPLDIPGPVEPMTHVVLGLAVHPTQNVLYAGFVAQDKLGVYTYDGTGALTFKTSVANTGKAICWIISNATGSVLYTTNTADNSISRYNNSNPLAPVESQHLVLQEGGVTYTDPMGHVVPTSEDYQLMLDPTGKNLYVLSQHTNPDFTVANGNILHTLTVAGDGTLSETVATTHLPVSAQTRPWGVVVF
ncbi:MAG: hypothetical protein ABJB66_01915 [Gemmatimonadaceae bacterium]